MNAPNKSLLRWFVVIFMMAFLVRGGLLFSHMTPHDCIRPESRSELGRIALSLHKTGEYANGYIIPTGLTAHSLPIETWLVSLIYDVFGVTLTAGYVRCFLQITIVSISYALLPWLGSRLGVGAGAGTVAGVAGAAWPQHGLHEVLGWSPGERMAAIALGLLMVGMVRRWSKTDVSFRSSLVLGIGFGISWHLAPPLLLVMLGYVAFELWHWRGRGKWMMTLALAMGAAIACVPWGLRNYMAFGEAFFIRSNFGLELRMGNHEGAVADIDVMDAREGVSMRHPGCNRAEAIEMQRIGEMAYMRQARREALDWIAANPGAFVRLTALRFLHFWCGPLHDRVMVAWVSLLTMLALVGAWRVMPTMTATQRAVVLIPLATFPLVYYIVVYMFRYREPVHWIIVLLAGAEVWHWVNRARGARSRTM